MWFDVKLPCSNEHFHKWMMDIISVVEDGQGRLPHFKHNFFQSLSGLNQFYEPILRNVAPKGFYFRSWSLIVITLLNVKEAKHKNFVWVDFVKLGCTGRKLPHHSEHLNIGIIKTSLGCDLRLNNVLKERLLFPD